MALSDYSRESLIPSFLYSAASPSKQLFDLEHLALNRNHMLKISSSSGSVPVSRSSSMKRSFVIPAPSEPGKIEMFSPAYFAACGVSGMLSTGPSHTAVTPMDVVKCNMQFP
ncbi:phosphate transporter 3;1 [Actinidia rufa]|uniref:Phosphate transporter 31 n=1 Tax=Actinidia rufa TaxID=165716 RepID=A0A7J0H2T4_9ERIC|nr:phosphate transporter 3;1 [Actinidia rufa]